MLPRDDNHDNPFTSYDYYKGYCPDDNPVDDVFADDWVLVKKGLSKGYFHYCPYCVEKLRLREMDE